MGITLPPLVYDIVPHKFTRYGSMWSARYTWTTLKVSGPLLLVQWASPWATHIWVVSLCGLTICRSDLVLGYGFVCAASNHCVTTCHLSPDVTVTTMLASLSLTLVDPLTPLLFSSSSPFSHHSTMLPQPLHIAAQPHESLTSQSIAPCNQSLAKKNTRTVILIEPMDIGYFPLLFTLQFFCTLHPRCLLYVLVHLVALLLFQCMSLPEHHSGIFDRLLESSGRHLGIQSILWISNIAVLIRSWNFWKLYVLYKSEY